MNVEIGAEAAQFPEKEYINGIAVAVWGDFGSRIRYYNKYIFSHNNHVLVSKSELIQKT
jgi:hypothetical protein